MASWNVNRGLERKLGEPDFIDILSHYDIVFLSECWISNQSNIDLGTISNGYSMYTFPRSKGKGGGMIVLFKNGLRNHIHIHKYVGDSIVWLKVTDVLESDLYICCTYIPHEHNVYYDLYDNDLFDALLYDISDLIDQGIVIVTGDLNSRVGEGCCDYIVNDIEPGNFVNDNTNPFTYINDSAMSTRKSEDKHVNTFGRKLLELCRASGLRICNGRVNGDSNGKYTFYNHLGSSVIDYVIVDSNHFDIIDNMHVCDFNTWSDHAPVEFTVRCKYDMLRAINETIEQDCTRTHSVYQWNDDQLNVMRQELENRVTSLYEVIDDIDRSNVSVDDGVDQITLILKNIFDPHCCTEIKVSSGNKQSREDKVWFDNKCRRLYSDYRAALRIFNRDHSNFNRTDLIEKKREYKRYATRMKRHYYRYEGNKLCYMRKNNPKKFYKLFKKKPSTRCTINSDEFFQYFKNICNTDNVIQVDANDNLDTTNAVFEELDKVIDVDEVVRVLKNLKCGKATGFDTLLNEYFAKFKDVFSPVLARLFNSILNCGRFPKSWSTGMIVPIHKKGNLHDVNNYRGITLVSNLSKIFTSLLNNRLLDWSGKFNVISDAQFGFKPGFGTTDAIFALHGLISNYLSNGKKLYCCFVDYRKAFDKIDRNKLFYKLARSGVTGKLLNIIQQIYSDLKSCVKHNSELSDFFSSTVGLMQGEALSPFLFSLYINDFESELISSNCEPVNLRDLSLFLLLYADDTVILSDSRKGLQNLLDRLYTYSSDWNIEVNIDKTKIVIFRKGFRLCRDDKWFYNNEPVEVVNSFAYLGITLNFNGIFTKTQSLIAQQGNKCMFKILKLCNDNYLNIETKLHVFDTYVASVLNYGAEVWGFHPGNDIEKVHTRFCKMILKVKNSTPNFMVYTELGRLPSAYYKKITYFEVLGKIIVYR